MTDAATLGHLLKYDSILGNLPDEVRVEGDTIHVAGRAIKVRSFEEYRARLLENFVVLDRSERHDKIASQLDAKAQRLQGRVSRTVRESSLLEEVPDLVEYPSVVAGTFAPEFLELPEEVRGYREVRSPAMKEAYKKAEKILGELGRESRPSEEGQKVQRRA